jgi:hypothetical protein
MASNRRFEELDLSGPLPDPPLLLGFQGPPGGGKTKSALRVADGMARVRGGKPALIDTEGGRALKYLRSARNPHGHDFHYFPFKPPFTPEDFLTAIRAALTKKPSAVIVDSMSDEHEGEGGYLQMHDDSVDSVGGNKWAAWARPSASRRALIAGLQQINTPLIFTFRAREKTRQEGKKIIPIGYMPVAGMEVVHTLDLTCLIPPRANGVALWQSLKEGEDFILKFPEFLAHLIRKGETLDERLGEELARWQAGESAASIAQGSQSGNGQRRRLTPEEQVDAYVAAVGKLPDLEALREYQAEPRRAQWIETMKGERPDLHNRIVEANAATFRRLQPPEPETNDDPPAGETDADRLDREFPKVTGNDDDLFPPIPGDDD